jgi:hypothetical protein
MPISGMSGIGVPDANINEVINSVTQPAKTSRFRQIVGNVVGTAGNVVMPGVGGIVGRMISGNPGTGTLLGPDTWSMLSYQQQMIQESQQFELISTILKNRHDSAMSAIRNMKSN